MASGPLVETCGSAPEDLRLRGSEHVPARGVKAIGAVCCRIRYYCPSDKTRSRWSLVIIVRKAEQCGQHPVMMGFNIDISLQTIEKFILQRFSLFGV